MFLGIVIGVVLAATGQPADLESFETNGLFIAVSTVVALPAGVGATWLFASLRRGLKARDYLRLAPVAPRSLWRWGIALLALVAVGDATTHLLGKPIVPDMIVSAYQTAGWMPLLLFAVIVCAPLGEEIFFRGFLFEGLMHSKLGPWGAIVATSLVWAAIHVQYDLHGMATIFAGGLLLGYARWKTGSIYTTIALHALMNIVASIQVFALVHYLGPLAE